VKLVVRLIALAMGALVIWFAVVNREAVELSLAPLPWRVGLPLYLALLIAFAAGAIAGGASHWLATWRRRRAARDDSRRLARLELEIEALRAERPPAAADRPAANAVERLPAR